MSNTHIGTRTITVPAGFQKTNLLVTGDFVFVTSSSIVVKVAMVGNDMNDIIELRRGQGLQQAGEFQKLEIWRSENDPNPDLPYEITFIVGKLGDKARLFFSRRSEKTHDGRLDSIPLGGRWRHFAVEGNYVKNLWPSTNGLVVEREGIEVPFTAGEEIRFSKDFESVAIGLSADEYLDMIISYNLTGTLSSRAIVFETGDYTRGVGSSS